MKRPPIIAIRIDEETFKRWEALDKTLPRGYKTTQARSYLLGLVRDLENDARHVVEEAGVEAERGRLRGITGKAAREEVTSSSGGRTEGCKACSSGRSLGCGGSEAEQALCSKITGGEGKCWGDLREHSKSVFNQEIRSLLTERGPDPAPGKRPEEAK